MIPYSLFIGVGAALGLWQVARHASERMAGAWVDAGLGVLVGMLLGGRAAYIGLHLAYYGAHPWEWIQIWQGGYSAWGAIGGGLIAAGLAAWVMELPFRIVLDGLSPLFPPLAILGWLGCLSSGCAYGPELPGGVLLAVPAVDEWGRVLQRFPLQIAAALVLLGYNWGVAALLAAGAARRAAPGLRAGWVGLGLAVVQYGVVMISPEPAPLWSGLPPDAWAALALGGLSLILVVVGFLKRK